MKIFKGINKKYNTKENEYHDKYNDINLAGARQVEQNIQDIIDEWWNNDNLTEEQQLIKNKLFPNGKPASDEFLITFVKYAREKPEFKKLQEEIERKKRKRQTIKNVIFLAFIFLFMLLVSIHISIMEKNETKKGSQTETSISMKGCWW